MPFSEDIYKQLSKPFDTIKEREGHGGQTYLYVSVGDVIKRINDVFGLNWNFEILREEVHSDNEQYTITNKTITSEPADESTGKSAKTTERTTNELKQKAKSITTLGRLSVRDPEGNVWIKEAWGSQEIKWKTDGSGMVNLGNDKKGAASDALKKAAELMGVALSISLEASKEQIAEIIAAFKKIQPGNVPAENDLASMSGLEAAKLLEKLQQHLEK